MRKTKRLAAMMVLVAGTAWGVTADNTVRYCAVAADENVLADPAQEIAAATAAGAYIVDGDETRGEVNLYFNDDLAPPAAPREILLTVNIADFEYAESEEGFVVFQGDRMVGQVKKVARNASVTVSLDLGTLRRSKSMKLTLRSQGKDGLYVWARRTGYGATLKMVY